MTIQELKTQIQNANELGRTNLANKNVVVSSDATTYEIMQAIENCSGGEVADSNGVTFGYEKKTITNTVTAGEGKCFYNGVELPVLPNDLIDFPYLALLTLDGSAYIYASTVSIYVEETSKLRFSKGRVRCLYDSATESWGEPNTKEDSTYCELSNKWILVWSNSDIPNGSATATDVYFKGTEPITSYTVTETFNVPVEREENYSVKSDDLSEIMKRIQKMVGTSKQLTIEEAIEQLDKIVYVPQGRAISSGSNINGLPITSNGFSPTIYYGTATSLGSNITYQPSTASGFLTEEGA